MKAGSRSEILPLVVKGRTTPDPGLLPDVWNESKDMFLLYLPLACPAKAGIGT
jgi:hypothetical protein